VNPIDRLMQLVDRIPDHILWWMVILSSIVTTIVFGWLATTVPNP